jgi:hypothetical protein
MKKYYIFAWCAFITWRHGIDAVTPYPVLNLTVFRNRTRIHYARQLSEDTDRTWNQWNTYPTLGIKHPGKPAHFAELVQREVYKEWLPTRRSTPSTCVVSMYSANLLKVGEWGRYAAENNLNWALSHGYKYSIFRNRLVNETVSFGWS